MSIILFGKVEASVDALKAQYEDKSVQPEYAHQWELEDLKEDLTKQIDGLEDKLDQLEQTQQKVQTTTMVSSSVNS